jgi:sugar O-acyltransferase (sialic acid O-acetyltransferase NeuD family)
MSRIGIFGTSGMAREAGDIAWELGLEPIYVARDQSELDEYTFSGRVILESDIDRYQDIGYVIGIGDSGIRQRIAQRYASRLSFVNLIHPSTSFGQGQRTRIESNQGVIVCAGVRFTSNISIGNFTIFNLNATINHDCIIGDYVTISPQSCVLGNVEIKTGVWIGAGAIINQGNTLSKLVIGENAMIGSGTIVLKNCDPNSTYVGTPARKVE